MKKAAIWLTALFCGASMIGCGTSSSNNTPSASGQPAGGGQQSITVAADTTFPPFETEKNGKVVGFDIEMIKDIAKVENIKINEIKTMPFTGLIPALQAGQVDVAVAGITIKTSRMGAVNFSDAYYKSGLSILTKADAKINGINDLKGKIVATKKGTSSVDLLNKNGITGAKEYDNIDQAYSALESGGADAVVFDNPVNINFKNSHSNVKIVGGLLTGEYYGIAISKKDANLLNKINDGLKKIQGNGDYTKLFDKYLGGDKTGLIIGVKEPSSVAVQG